MPGTRRWWVHVGYYNRAGRSESWEAEIEAETSEDARTAGERRIRQERHGVPEAIDAYVEPIGDDDSTPHQ
jgi:hypothetical protein